MSQSMGEMMLQMHTGNTSIRDLLIQNEAAEQMTGMETHQGSSNESVRISHYLTTLIIVLGLPFVLAGGVFLLMVWWK